MRRVIVIGLGLVALAACQKSEEKAASAEGAAAPAAANAPGALGVRKAGLWSHTIESMAGKQTMKVCMAAEDLSKADAGPGMGEDKCSKQTVTPRPGGWAFESVCEGPEGGTTTNKGTATGNGEGYMMEATSTTTGSSMPQANMSMTVKVEAKWEGPCPEGVSPGQVVEANVAGMKVDRETLEALKKLGK